MTPSRRFDYVQYDLKSMQKSERFKLLFDSLENELNELLSDSRYKSLCITDLEKAYMWIGKALRDETIGRTPIVQHKPERG